MNDNDLGDLRFSLKHRLAMALTYRNPRNYLLPDEMPLYAQRLREVKDKFKDVSVEGDYRIEQIDTLFYVVGHGEISTPSYSFENALKLLIQKETSLRPHGNAEK